MVPNESWLISETITLVYDEKNLSSIKDRWFPPLALRRDHYKEASRECWQMGSYLWIMELWAFIFVHWSPSLTPENSQDCLYYFPWCKNRNKALQNLESDPFKSAKYPSSFKTLTYSKKLPVECYYFFTTEMRAPLGLDTRGQGEWKIWFGGYSKRETFIKNMVTALWKESRGNFKWETGDQYEIEWQ